MAISPALRHKSQQKPSGYTNTTSIGGIGMAEKRRRCSDCSKMPHKDPASHRSSVACCFFSFVDIIIKISPPAATSAFAVSFRFWKLVTSTPRSFAASVTSALSVPIPSRLRRTVAAMTNEATSAPVNPSSMPSAAAAPSSRGAFSCRNRLWPPQLAAAAPPPTRRRRLKAGAGAAADMEEEAESEKSSGS